MQIISVCDTAADHVMCRDV